MVLNELNLLLFFCFCLFPTFGVGLLDFELDSSPRPGTLRLFSSPGLLLETPWSIQPRDFLECPTPETP